MELAGKGKLKQVIIEAEIIRADGSRVDLGVISDSKWKWYKPWTRAAKKAATQRIEVENAKVGS